MIYNFLNNFNQGSEGVVFECHNLEMKSVKFAVKRVVRIKKFVYLWNNYLLK